MRSLPLGRLTKDTRFSGQRCAVPRRRISAFAGDLSGVQARYYRARLRVICSTLEGDPAMTCMGGGDLEESDYHEHDRGPRQE